MSDELEQVMYKGIVEEIMNRQFKTVRRNVYPWKALAELAFTTQQEESAIAKDDLVESLVASSLNHDAAEYSLYRYFPLDVHLDTEDEWQMQLLVTALVSYLDLMGFEAKTSPPFETGSVRYRPAIRTKTRRTSSSADDQLKLATAVLMTTLSKQLAGVQDSPTPLEQDLAKTASDAKLSNAEACEHYTKGALNIAKTLSTLAVAATLLFGGYRLHIQPQPHVSGGAQHSAVHVEYVSGPRAFEYWTEDNHAPTEPVEKPDEPQPPGSGSSQGRIYF